MRFKNWVEEYGRNKEEEIRDLWNLAFKELEIGGLDRAKSAKMSLKDITAGGEREESANSTVMNRLGNVFERLKSLGDRELAQNVETAMQWLGKAEGSHGDTNAPVKNVEGLMRRLFGDERFSTLLNSEDMASDSEPQMKVPAAQQFPDQQGGEGQQFPADPAAPPDQPPAGQVPMPGQQPQVPPQDPMMQPTNQPPMGLAAWKQWKGKRLQESS
jgi:hypothetical protein